MNWWRLVMTGWHIALMLGASYAGSHPEFGWAAAPLTITAGLSNPPVVPRAPAVALFAGMVLVAATGAA